MKKPANGIELARSEYPGGGLADELHHAIRSYLDSAIQMLTEANVLTDADFRSGACQVALCHTVHIHKHNSDTKDKLARF